MKRVTSISFKTAVALALAGASITGTAQTTNVPPDQFKAFELVSKRNIFDANRMPDRPSVVRTQTRVAVHVPKVETIALTGTMVYERGAYAFFNSSDFRYNGTLGPNEEVAGFRVSEIGFDYVTLVDMNPPKATASTEAADAPKADEAEGTTNVVAGVTAVAGTNNAIAASTNVVAQASTNAAIADATNAASAVARVTTNNTVDSMTNHLEAASTAASTNHSVIRLAVGFQLRREDEGPWSVVAGSGSKSSRSSYSRSNEGGGDRGFDRGNDRASYSTRNSRSSRNSTSSYSSSSSSSSSASSSSGGNDEEILKRLMQKREQELNK
jgi:hypothetical protein